MAALPVQTQHPALFRLHRGASAMPVTRIRVAVVTRVSEHDCGRNAAGGYSLLLGRLVRCCRPVLAICSWSVTDYALGRITIDQRTQIERMLHAANFVFDGMHHLAAVRIDDVLESILMLIALLAD